MKKNWWHNAIVYQIYPRSFMDANADGIGDIKGITSKLDYLSDLGVNTIWLCPVFASPMIDNGYDVSDYKAINPDFGTMEDLDELIQEAKKRDIKILLDLVLNHSSDLHPWFKSAVSDPESPYRDYYIFRKGKNGGAPNNWRSNFGGSAWEQVPDGEYYLHLFAKGQPDLNWENPALRRELFDMIRWWMDKGVAGFRVDAITAIKKDLNFPDLPVDGPDGLADPTPCAVAYPGIEAFLAEMRDEAFAPCNAYTVAEAGGVRPDQLEEFIGENGFFSTIFDFSYTDIDLNSVNWHDRRKFTSRELRDAIFKSQQDICGIGHGAVYLENHDQNRSPNKYLQAAEIGYMSKTMLGTLYFFLQGIPFVYQGQELGMTNHPWQSIDEFDDIFSSDQYQRAISAGLSKEEALAAVAYRARDNSRTPMLWSNAENAGFTSGKPWLPIHPDYPQRNADTQSKHDKSVFSYYKSMTALRKEFAELFYDGEMLPRFTQCDDLFSYERRLNGTGILVVCNFHNEQTAIDLPCGTVLLSNCRDKGAKTGGSTELSAFEATVILL